MKKKPKKEWEGEEVLMTSIVTKIEEQNKVVSERYKNVFYLQGKDGKDDVLCIHWGRGCFDVGDILTCHGRLKDNVMVCWDYLKGSYV